MDQSCSCLQMRKRDSRGSLAQSEARTNLNFECHSFFHRSQRSNLRPTPTTGKPRAKPPGSTDQLCIRYQTYIHTEVESRHMLSAPACASMRLNRPQLEPNISQTQPRRAAAKASASHILIQYVSYFTHDPASVLPVLRLTSYRLTGIRERRSNRS